MVFCSAAGAGVGEAGDHQRAASGVFCAGAEAAGADDAVVVCGVLPGAVAAGVDAGAGWGEGDWQVDAADVDLAESFPRDLIEATQANAAQPGALRAMIHWYRAFLRGGGLRRQLRQGFPVIEVPTLLIWGEEDPFLAKYTTDGTEEFVRDLRRRFLPGVSHWVQQDATEECNAALREFLKR